MENEQTPELEQAKSEEEVVQEKPELTPEQIRGIKQRQLTKLAKELGIEVPKPESKDTQFDKSNKPEPDYARLAYLETKGVSNDEDIEWIEETARDSGKSLKELFAATWFTKELQERKEARTTRDAIPTGSKRAGNAARDTVDYWIAKGELPPRDQFELRKQVLNARISAEKNKSQFTDNPIV